jgi:hypothetical protein
MVQAEAVAVGVAEDGAATDPGIPRLDKELGSGLFEPRSCCRHIIDSQHDRAKRQGENSNPTSSGTTIESARLPVSNSIQVGETSFLVSPSVRS